MTIDSGDEYLSRPLRYKNIDGILEMGVGVIMSGTSALSWFWLSTPKGSFWDSHLIHSVLALILLLIVLWGQRAFKRRITFPRTGFVKYLSLGFKPWLVGALIGGVGFVFYFFLFRHSELPVVVVVGSTVFALLYAYATKLVPKWRWIILIAMIALPVWASTLPLEKELLDILCTAALGMTWLVSGFIALCVYLAHNPVDGENGK